MGGTVCEGEGTSGARVHAGRDRRRPCSIWYLTIREREQRSACDVVSWRRRICMRSRRQTRWKSAWVARRKRSWSGDKAGSVESESRKHIREQSASRHHSPARYSTTTIGMCHCRTGTYVYCPCELISVFLSLKGFSTPPVIIPTTAAYLHGPNTFSTCEQPY